MHCRPLFLAEVRFYRADRGEKGRAVARAALCLVAGQALNPNL
ncbi:hypothetical protein ANTHELSMS3_03621 [Antarctobacter heliothermus]|uniref:Uncharacterized protein n=1 Tax=Antarctobacter heliothermus TaxID=74033 RepID=A0A222E7R4_9RHOB|nr:hypothetical protein ANTHELSMS3_03621 [Antarctobacter heliothermus]